MRSNTTEVRSKVRDHILEYFTKDMGWNDDNAVANLKEQLKSLDYMLTDYAKGKYMAEGGTFLVYYHDIEQFLKTLDSNNSDKNYSNANTWELYQHLVASEVEKIVRVK